MKVLIIAHKPPYPPKDGGCLAIYNVALGLFQSNIDVEVFCVETDKHPFKLEDAKNIPFKISSGYVDTRLKPIAALKSLIKDKSYNISRFYCKIFERKLVKKLQSKNYDIVQLETLFVTPYIQTIKNNSNSKIVYRSHNVEYKIWKHLAQGEKKLIKKSYLNKLTKQLKSYEYSTLNKYDGAAFITEIDRKYYKAIGCKQPQITIPFSIDIAKYKKNTAPSNSICYLGSLDWLPNSEGVDWFINNVWSSLQKSSEYEFYLAGRNMPNRYYKYASSQLHVLGEVHDAIEFINEHKVVIVPLFSGSGMRVKIIEALALGKVVIGTNLAFEGIEGVKHKINAIVCDTPNQFVENITEVLKNDKLYKAISDNGKNLIEKNYSIESSTKKLITFYETLIHGA